MSHTYTAFGLGVHSQVALPELAPAPSPCDVLIEMDEPAPLRPDLPAAQPCVAVSDGEAWFHVPQRGTFRVQHGRHITCAPLPGVAVSTLSGLLTGTLMGFLLHQRGFLVLHASCVDVGGRAAAFLGESGWGKSSLAAAMHARGHRLLADDVTCIDLSGDTALVRPAYPQLKLAPQAAGALGIAADDLHPLSAEGGKLAYRSASAFAREAVPLVSIYVLEWGRSCSVQPLGPQQAVIEGVRHSFPTRFGCAGGASHFLRCARLVSLARLSRFTRPHSLPDLQRLASRIEDDLGLQPPVGETEAAGVRRTPGPHGPERGTPARR